MGFAASTDILQFATRTVYYSDTFPRSSMKTVEGEENGTTVLSCRMVHGLTEPLTSNATNGKDLAASGTTLLSPDHDALAVSF